MKRGFVVIAILLPILLLSVQPALADIDVVVSGNGENSSSNITISNSQAIDSGQSNTTHVENNVSQTVDTGHNTANDNSGSVDITTGDIRSQTSVANSTNNSVIIVPCCSSSNSGVVDANGANSNNNVSFANSVSTEVYVTQLAVVTNNVSIYGNTGENHALGNSGSVTISTGSIEGLLDLVNSANSSSISAANGNSDANININNNGTLTTNKVALTLLGNVNIWKNELANIDNNIYVNLNTGGNIASGDLNNILIKTGDIRFDVSVVNGPINTDKSNVLCCDNGQPIPPEKPPKIPDNPSAPPTGGTNPSSFSNPIVGTVISAMTDILPATGASAIHFWIMAVVYLLIFLSGLYLRLRAGRSPNYHGYKLLFL